MFCKTSRTVLDHGANVIIPKIAQDNQADYEGELVSFILSLFSLHVLFNY